MHDHIDTGMRFNAHDLAVGLQMDLVSGTELCFGVNAVLCDEVQIFFGNTYSDAVIPFRILSIGYFFAGTFRIPAGNVLSALRKVNINLLVAIASGLLNIILNILLIKLFYTICCGFASIVIILTISTKH